MKSNFLGRVMLTTRSVYEKISTIMSSSVSGAGCEVFVSTYVAGMYLLVTYFAFGVRAGVHLSKII